VNSGIVVDGVRKSFGDVAALRGVSFTVADGEVVGLLGPNGAGKTTMVDILATLTRPDGGRASVAGHDVVAEPAQVRRSIMLTGQQAAVDKRLTGTQNLVFFGRLQGLKKRVARNRAAELIRDFELDDAADRQVGTYSGGMRRRIDIACGLVVQPMVAFLDEPTTGLDPRSRRSIWDLVSGFKALGIATLLTTQYLEEADVLCDRIIVIDHGAVIAEGTADDLKARAGGGFCDVVPKNREDLPWIADAVSPLLDGDDRAAVQIRQDRITVPARDGAKTVVAVSRSLELLNIELVEIALRRPTLDDVFFALTKADVMS
jgi:ABC-2 type transport system ATP-binding protein